MEKKLFRRGMCAWKEMVIFFFLSLDIEYQFRRDSGWKGFDKLCQFPFQQNTSQFKEKGGGREKNAPRPVFCAMRTNFFLTSNKENDFLA